VAWLHVTRRSSFLALCVVLGMAKPVLAQFETRGTFAFGDYPISAAVGDFNHDGKLDVAVAQNSSTTDDSTHPARPPARRSRL
jgi:hypothetical protein